MEQELETERSLYSDRDRETHPDEVHKNKIHPGTHESEESNNLEGDS